MVWAFSMIKCMGGWGIQPGRFLTPQLNILCWNGTQMISNESWCVHLSNFLKYDTFVLKKLLNQTWLDSSPSHTFNALLLSNLKIIKNFHKKNYLLKFPTCSRHNKMLIFELSHFLSQENVELVLVGFLNPPYRWRQFFMESLNFQKFSYTTPTIGTPHVF